MCRIYSYHSTESRIDQEQAKKYLDLWNSAVIEDLFNNITEAKLKSWFEWKMCTTLGLTLQNANNVSFPFYQLRCQTREYSALVKNCLYWK